MFFEWLPLGADTGSTYMLARWVFLRALGIIYLVAFVSFWVQIRGLIGSGGILPIQENLAGIEAGAGGKAWQMLPTLFWFNASDLILHVVCGLGALFSVLLIVGFIPTLSLAVLWILYLSLFSAGQDFMSFQWDILLLEVGFASIFFAPLSALPGIPRETAVPTLVLLALWLILFKLMFQSGLVKLSSGDSSWWNLTALDYHYFTQPLPHALSWYAHHLPAWFQKLSLIIMYAILLGCPFLMFLPPPVRYVAFGGLVLLQILIALTGNYNFFNLLAIALCLLLIDDHVWKNILPERLLQIIGASSGAVPLAQPFQIGLMVVGLVFITFTALHLVGGYYAFVRVPGMQFFYNLHISSSYGLFRVMTKDRPEIIIEGSDDGRIWKAYEFRYKPGDLSRAPGFAAPHQPRLDWQMWFAALSTFDRTFWFQRFEASLLKGSPDVLALLKYNPFPDAPPKFIRAQLYNYEFTMPKEHRETGNWWKRTFVGPYSPELTLR